MITMTPSQILSDQLISALRKFANALNASGNAETDMSALVEVSSRLPLGNFEHWEHLTRCEFSFAVDAIPSKWLFIPKPPLPLTWLDLASWDGYRREKSLRALTGAAPNTFFFLLAVRRLNDWVPQVRQAAREKLLEMASNTNANCVAEALCITFCHWHSWGRIAPEDRSILLQIVCQDQVAKALIAKLISSTAGPMPSIFSQLGRTLILDGNIEKIAEFAIQPSLRAKAYRSLFEGRIAWFEGHKWESTDYFGGRKLAAIVSARKIAVEIPLRDLLTRAAADRSSIVRRVSAEFLIRDMKTLGVWARELAEKFAADESSAVSERGVFALQMLSNEI